MINIYAKSGEVNDATDCFNMMHAQGLTPDAVSFNTVMKAFVKHENIDGAEYWFHEMQGSGVKPDTVSYNVMISTCARAKDADRAEGWLKKLLAQKGAVEADAVSFCM